MRFEDLKKGDLKVWTSYRGDKKLYLVLSDPVKKVHEEVYSDQPYRCVTFKLADLETCKVLHDVRPQDNEMPGWCWEVYRLGENVNR